MKLFIIISVIAYSYAEKLDNTYLPPTNAATAGGAPGSLTAPGAQTLPGLSNAPSSFGQLSGAAFGQPSRPVFGQGTSQTGPQAGSVQPGQVAIGQYTPQQYGQTGALTQAGRPDYNQESVGDTQAGTAPVAGSPGIGQGSLGYNQPGTLAGSSRPDFGQASAGYNQAPTFGGQAQVTSIYAGQPQPERARASIDRNAEILRYDNQNNGDSYTYSFETSNGIAAEQSGVATNGVRAQGSFAYTGDDGQQYRVTYTADENGYLPQGDHLPTPPPIPEEILKSLEENARAAAAGTQEGAYNPNEDLEEGLAQQSNGIYTGQGQPGQSGAGYGPSQGSAAGPRQQGFQNQGPVSQYGAGSTRLPEAQAGLGSSSNAPYGASRQPVSGSEGYSGLQGSQSLGGQYGAPGYQGNQSPTSQYNAAGVSPSGIASASRPDFSTQNSKTDDIKYGFSIGSPSGSVIPEQQGLNPNSGYQYNAPGSSSRPGQFQPDASQVSIGQNPTTQYNRPRIENISVQGRPTTASQYGTPSGSPGTYRPRSQTPVGGAGSGSLAARPNQSSYNYNGLNTSPQTGSSSTPSFASQGNQNSGYNYNAPTGLPSFRPLGSGTLNRPQGFSPQTNQVQSSQNIPQGTQALQLQGGQFPSTQYGGRAPSSSSPIRPSGSQENQFSQYGGSSPTSSDLQQNQSGSNQRPQLGNSGQKQDDGYQYNRPQSLFNTPSQTGIKPSGPSSLSNNFNQFNRPSLGTTSSKPVQGTTAFSGNNYAPSGSISAGPTMAPNVFGSPKPSGSINQGYPSGPVSSGSTSSGPVLIGQGANIPRPGQYSSVGPTSGPTNTAFSRPAISTAYKPTSQYQTGQNSGPGSTSVGSAPYQYNRPSTQGPSSSAAQTPFGSQPGSGSTSLVQDNSGRVESQPSYGVSAQDRPRQTGSQSGFEQSKQERPSQISSQSGYRPSGQERPAENFGGPRQPPSFSPEEGYKY